MTTELSDFCSTSFLAESQELLVEVHNLFKKEFGLVLPEMFQKEVLCEHTSTSSQLDYFVIKYKACPIYESVNSISDAVEVLGNILENSKDMETGIAVLLDENERDLDKTTIEAIEMIIKQVTIFNKAYQVRKKNVTFVDSVNINEIRQEVYAFLAKIIKENLIGRIIPAIAMGMQGKSVSMYELILDRVNLFLISVGIHTAEIRAGEKIDFDLCCPVEAGDNITDDYQKRDVIKEVKRLPYIFNRGHIVAEGEVVAWRLESGT